MDSWIGSKVRRHDTAPCTIGRLLGAWEVRDASALMARGQHEGAFDGAVPAGEQPCGAHGRLGASELLPAVGQRHGPPNAGIRISQPRSTSPTMASWTEHDLDMYEAIKSSLIGRGVAAERAAEIAGRTVNKNRRQQGRTPNVRTQGTGNPHSSLDERTRDELYNRAKELGIPGRSSMTKAELIGAIRKRNG